MPSRRFKTMEKWLFEELDPNNPTKVKYNDKVAKYFNNDGNAVIAFYNHLNTNSKFAGDGLALLPGDIVHGPKVRQLLAAIVDDYLRRGWTVS